MPLLPTKRRLVTDPGILLPATVVAVTAGVPSVLVDGAATPIDAVAGYPYVPGVGDRVGLLGSGSNYLALPLDAVTPNGVARGIVARNNTITNNPGATTPAQIALTASAALLASRYYRVWTTPTLLQSTVAGDVGQTRILVSAAGGSVSAASTLLTLDTAACPVANSAQFTSVPVVEFSPATDGTYQFGVGVIRNTGAGVITTNLAIGRSLSLVVEDIGPAIANTP